MVNPEFMENDNEDAIQLCDRFEVGQEFIVEGLDKPENFCTWAWSDIQKSVLILLFDGKFDFSPDKKSAITCCTDGKRPVIFLVEKLD